MQATVNAVIDPELPVISDANTVVMRGIVGFKQFYPEWKGHWNYIVKDNRETVNRSQTLSFKRSNKVWPFIPEDEKQNFDIFTDSNRRGVKNSFPDYQEYISSHLKKYACEFCGLWEGTFYMENSRVPIKESFRLGICYYGKADEFDQSKCRLLLLDYNLYASHLLYDIPSTGVVLLQGMGENEFGLFKALVCIHIDTGVMTTIKSYITDHLSSVGGYIGSGTVRNKGESLQALRQRLQSPSSRRRKPTKSEEIMDVCDVCNSPEEKAKTASGGQNGCLIHCSVCGVCVHAKMCYGVDITTTTAAINTKYWVCDPCLYYAWNRTAPLQHCLCVCCQFPGGALKRSIEGEWCHISCMLFSNHLSVLSFTNMEPIYARTDAHDHLPLSALPHDLFYHTCCLCKTNRGITEKCCIPGCSNHMHGRCLRFYQYPQQLVKRESEKSAGVASSSELAASPQSTLYSIFVYRDDDGHREVKCYCPLHGVSKESQEGKKEGESCNGIYTIEYPNSEVYKGEVHNGKREGYGEYYYGNGIVYRGEWYNDREHGKGEYSRGDDIVYKGDFADGRINGYGIYFYDNGDIYDGFFREGLRNNTGVYLFHGGSTYDGEWKDDRRNGMGTLVDVNDNMYTGEWKGDYREGRGDLVCKQLRRRLVDRETGEEAYPKQQRLISHVSDRVKEAEEGVERRRDEVERKVEEETVEEMVKYSGQFRMNQLEGAGALYYGTGDMYKGMFHQDLRDGRGTYAFKNYSLYGIMSCYVPIIEGHFREDRIEGVGTVTVATNVRVKRDEIFMPVILPQGTIKEVHKAAGFEENGT